MKTAVLLLAPSLVLLACGPTTTIHSPMPGTIRSYGIGEPFTVAIGDPIVTVERAAMLPAWEATQNYQPPQGNSWDGGYRFAPIPRGLRFAHRYTRSDGAVGLQSGQYLATPWHTTTEGMPTIWISPSGVPLRATLGPAWDQIELFRATDDSVALEPGFRAEIIYSGLTGRTLKTLYREYSRDYNRPAFTTELTYNLDESSVVAYKSLRIEILEATNQSLRARVVSDDGLPWLR